MEYKIFAVFFIENINPQFGCPSLDSSRKYGYDNKGNLTSKVIKCFGENDEQIKFYAEGDKYYSNSEDYQSFVETFRKEPFGNVEKIESNGKNNTGEILSIVIEYDDFNEKIVRIKNNLGGGNQLRYNEKGRLSEVSPFDFNENVMYGFKVTCNDSFDEIKHYLTSREDGLDEEILLTEKIINQSTRVITDNKYRDKNIDTTQIILDKYGKVESVNEDGKITTFLRQNLAESESISEVREKYDPFEKRTYCYEYDENNNVKKYFVLDEDGKEFQRFEATGDNKTETKNSAVSDLYLSSTVSDISYDKEKLMNPRITKCRNEYLNSLSNEVEYNYDKFGRAKGKTIKFNNYSKTEIQQGIKYHLGTLLKRTTDYYLINKGAMDLELLTYEYDSKGNIIESHTKDKAAYYKYNQANQLSSENYTDFIRLYGLKEYKYNIDGSLEKEEFTYNSQKVTKAYFYQKGRLRKINDGKNDIHFDYDTLGNCTHYKSSKANIVWERGNLLVEYETNKYYYNSQKERFRKNINGKVTTYYLDGGKLLGEKDTKRTLSYLYDLEGIMGISASDKDKPYYFLKDISGNVIAIADEFQVVGRYEYDAFGNTYVIAYDSNGNVVSEQQDSNHIAYINPIRWKSLYQDLETGFYYIGGRYYSPEIKQYLSPVSPEAIMERAFTIYGLYPYLLSVENPIGLIYNSYDLSTSIPVVWDPPEISKFKYWQKRFFDNPVFKKMRSVFKRISEWWNGLHWGWKLAIGVVVIAALVVATVVTAGGAAAGFGAMAGATSAGWSAMTPFVSKGANLAFQIGANAFTAGGLSLTQQIVFTGQVDWAAVGISSFFGGLGGMFYNAQGLKVLFISAGLGISEEALGFFI